MRRIFTLFLFAILLGGYAMAYDFSETSNGITLYYNITSSTSPYTVEIVPQTPFSPFYYSANPSGDFTIPSSVTYNGITYSVTSIGHRAFQNCRGLTSVTIPNSVTSIGETAFYYCNGLTSVTIPSSVTSIGESAFYGCSGLTSVTIPNSVTSIGDYAFSSCSGLTSLTIGNSITSIGESAFSSTAWYNNQPDGIVYLNNCCLGYKGNKPTGNLIIEEGTRCIAEFAFWGCNELTTVTIPNSVVNIGFNAFYNCSGLNEPVYNANCFAYFPNGYATEYAIPDGIQQICASAFINCTNLTSVTIPNSVVSIDAQAFYGCSGLSGTLIIPNSVTSIGNGAFSSCSGLTSITIPNSVTSIGNGAFSGCSGITEPLYNANCFAYFPSGYATIYIIPDGIQQICGNAFMGCRELTSVTIPSSVTSIGYNAFANCIGLTSITIPNSVTSIDEGAFNYCQGLTSVSIPNSVKSIGFGTFGSCSGLTSVTIPNSVTYIDQLAFAYCRELVTVTIGNSVTSIGSNAFRNCSGLTDIYVNPTTPPIVSSPLGNNTATLWVPCGLADTYQAADGWNSFSDIREHFAYELSVSSANTQQGTASITQQPNCTNSSTAIIMATPVELYHFVSWNDGNTENPRTITVESDTTFTATFAIDQFTVTVESANETMGTVSGGGTFDFSTETHISATPAEHYHFVSWNDGNTNNPRTITVESDTIFTATFAIDQFAVTVESANETMGTVIGSGTFDYGTETQISATAAEHYHFVSWNDGNTQNPRTITVESDSTFTANFAIDQFTVTVVSANETMGTVSGNGTFDYGTETQISATANEHYHFVSWNDGNTSNPRMITVESDTTFTATFAIDQFPVTVVSDNESMGTVSGSGTYDYGTETQISATANEHYHFVQWNDGNTDNPRTIIVGPTENCITIGTGTFRTEKVPFYSSSNYSFVEQIYTAEEIGNSGQIRSISFYHKPEETLTDQTNDIVLYMKIVSRSAFLDDDYERVTADDIVYSGQWTIQGEEGWSTIYLSDPFDYDGIGNLLVAMDENSSGNSPRYFTCTNITDYPTFYFYSFSNISPYSPGGLGLGHSGATYHANAKFCINDNNSSYTAIFAIDQHTIIVSSANETMGAVSGSGTYNYGTETQISATANEHYHFVSWNDGNTSNPRMITVESDTIFTATFAANEFTITVATETSRINSEPTFIPDGPNCTTQCYTSDITFSDFNEDAVVENADAIKYVKLNMEHSFIGDLQIKITCPEDANHNRRSAIMLQDYYSNESGNDLYSSNAIDEYSYNWPISARDTAWLIGTSSTVYYTSQNMLSRIYYTADRDATFTSDGMIYYQPSFDTGTEAWYFIENYMNRWYTVHTYLVYYATDDNNNTFYFIGFEENDDIYIVWLDRNTTTDTNSAFRFSSQLAAQSFARDVFGTTFVTYTSVGAHHSYHRIYFGEPDIYDIVDGVGLASAEICDENDEHNISGVGYDYAWTSSSQYNTIGYVYDSENIATPSIFYDNGVVSDTSLYHVMPSDVETGVQMYQPFQSFNNLVGCPLNGTWTISVCDNMAHDNGYVFDWEIAISGDENNMGTVAGGGTYNEGEEISISATPAEHYHFVSWNDGNTENPRIVTVTEDATFSAIFAIDQHTIVVGSADEAFGTVSGGGTYDYGTESQISATANEHYHFVRWNDGNTENPRTITVAGDVTYTATFAIDQFAVTVVSANESMGTVSGSGTYNYGTETQISATANEHYHFVQWNDGNTENPRTITVAEEATYTAEFTIDQHTITVVSSNETMGAVSGGGTFEYGIETQISAIPAEHHHFVSWNDGNTENPRTITVFADTTYTATFAVDVTNYTITAVSANPNYGTVTGGGTYAEGTEITLTAMPNEGYEFVQWNDERTENPRTITVTENAIYIATFAAATVPTIYNEFTAAACESYAWNDSIYTESGDYTQTFMAASSADSIVTLHLTIYPLPQPEITVDGILDACNPESASVSLSTGEYSAYNWSTGETSETITVTEIGNYYVEVVDGNGCHGVSEMATVGYSSVLTEAPQLKRVGMSNTGTNIVQWIVTDTTGVRGFEIYRENTEANVFELIGRVTNPRQRSWTDPTAEPAVRAYRYKICAVDECGGLSPLSDYHKTMHLTINRGMGTDWNLIWSHYEGFEYATYKIYRGTNTRDMIIIGQIPSTLNSFTDNTNTFEEGMFYKVEIVRTRNTKDGEEEEDIPLYSNIVANEFVENYTVTAVGNNVAYGTVAGGGTYPAGLDITLTALPNTGYEFVSWSDGSTENPRVITVSGDAMYIATFEEIQSVEYTITVMSANPNRGTVTGGGTYPVGTVVTIEATAFDGFEFVSWSDENTENPRQITVTADATYVASFDPATGIEETSAFEIALFPNPVTDILNITSPETISEIEIVNMMGQVVKRMEVNADNAVCDVEDLKAGVYVVRIRTASAMLSQRKFIKE